MDQIINKTIIDVLLEKNRLSANQAANFGKNLSNEEIEKRLRAGNLVSSEDIAKAYAVVYDLPFVRLESYEIQPEAGRLIPTDLAQKYHIMAFEKVDPQRIKVAIGNPAQLKTHPPTVLSELREKKGISIDLYITTPEDIESVAKKMFQSAPSAMSTSVPVQSDYPVPEKIDLTLLRIPFETISKFPVEISQKYKMVVFANPDPTTIHVAVANPDDKKVKEILDFVREKNDLTIKEFTAPAHQIEEAIKIYYQKPSKKEESAGFIETKPQVPASPVPIAQSTPEPKHEVPVVTAINSAPVPPASGARPAGERVKFTRRPLPYQLEQAQQQMEHPAEVDNDMLRAAVSPENDLDNFLGQEIKTLDGLKAIIQTGNVPQILAGTIALAVSMKASDIHIEAEERDLRFRFRLDGVLEDVIKAPLTLLPALVSRVKILSRLKIDEARVPQDGRFDVRTQNHDIDLRVSTLPTVRGEKVAIRILDKSQNIYTFEELGLAGRNLKIVEENIVKPYGVILSTGPTGSGKSTTLYSILKKTAGPQVNVVTLEDPVEYEIPGINQCQVKPKIGFSFAEGLRSVLRQDPNIIMVGEVRDAETAGMATHAALTGHLVLTTLHTNDAAGALPRLINMGIEPFLITSSMLMIIGQRLVRKVCQNCKQEIQLPPPLLAEIDKELQRFNLQKPLKFFEGKGCPQCHNGFSGRIGIFEVLSMSDKIEAMAIARRPASELRDQAVTEGMVTMKQDGLIKATKGLTSVSEVLRVTLTE